jgi:nucleotide-binding universal stress UspA family protein
MPVIGVRPALNLERILFATDFSAAARVAESYARALAQRFGSTVDVVHVFDPTDHDSQEGDVLLPVNKLRRKLRQRRVDGVAAELAEQGVVAESMLCEGHPPARELLGLLEQSGADLVVMGTHCKRSVERFIAGSTAEELIRKANRPVLTVGPNTRVPAEGPLTFRNIVYATDFSAQAAKAAVFALSFAEDSGAHLYYCHVPGPTDGAHDAPVSDAAFRAELQRLVPDCSYEWCDPQCVVEHGRAADGVLKLARRVNADLIVLGPRKPTFALTHLERGVTLQVLCDTECPVLTVC